MLNGILHIICVKNSHYNTLKRAYGLYRASIVAMPSCLTFWDPCLWFAELVRCCFCPMGDLFKQQDGWHVSAILEMKNKMACNEYWPYSLREIKCCKVHCSLYDVLETLHSSLLISDGNHCELFAFWIIIWKVLCECTISIVISPRRLFRRHRLYWNYTQLSGMLRNCHNHPHIDQNPLLLADMRWNLLFRSAK